ncbi:DUF6544 family protein [Billgrantia kenyensis]|uniref:Uncharacterized protein n=1 Tax=Billgrantia kenyensis TaxID=321266 RepID=A0A7W0AF68_9GAMM|nr:DUF6544 family protein [Halomonas kenyensis]MBA2780309.1 hypothetical protein [Halomonas kenyensis]MCG6663225.1 hypothetical protein [Halomonas kenyensis]
MAYLGGVSALLLALVLTGVLAMQAWRLADNRAMEQAWAWLQSQAPATVETFDPAMVEDLPDAARRYFLYTIAPGTPLHVVSEIHMTGEIGLGSKEDPGYRPMRARQILAPPHGFIWQLERAGSGLMQMSGSDGMAEGRSWTRFWLNGTLPVARAGGDGNHLRASFGRAVAEAAFWAPAALLPQHGVRWQETGVRWEETGEPNLARAIITHGTLEQAIEIAVAENGQPRWVQFQRWSDANPEKEWRLQPFGGYLDDFQDFEGFTLPTKVEAGNHFGTEAYFPFFRVRVEEVRFSGA